MKTALSHLYTPTKPAEVQASFNTLKSALYSTEACYISTPVTGGTRYTSFLSKGMNKDAHTGEYRADVVWPNVRSACGLFDTLRKHHSPVVNPAHVMQPGWVDDDYMALWLAVIQNKLVTRVVVNEGWYASQGCVMEVAEAFLTDTPIYDCIHVADGLDKAPTMSFRAITSAIWEGRGVMLKYGAPAERHDQALSALMGRAEDPSK